MADADALQRIFKTFSDPTRLRILRLLEREELMVQELMDVLGMAQSRVSRHLAILREAGLLSDRRDGTYVFYRFKPPGDAAWRDAWALVSRNWTDDPTAERDAAALARVIEARGERSKSFFDAVGPEWDALRKVFNDDVLRARAIGHLVSPGLRVAESGTGTGILALELARLGLDIVAIDHSARMLDAARKKLEPEYSERVELRRADAHDLPLADAEMDAALAHMVMHSMTSPADAIREMARVVKPGGVVVLVDFVRHDQEWMRQELGVLWLGFDLEELTEWLARAGLEAPQIETHRSASRGRDLPATFIAAARRPGS
jgi:ArsR family transcriptional regulator